MSWRVRARVVFLQDRPNGVPSYRAPRCPTAPLCAAPTRPARGVSVFWSQQLDIPGNVLHEKSFQRHIGVVALVSGQERRALLVPVMIC